MVVALIIMVAVLLVLVAVISLKGWRPRQAMRKHEQDEARVTAEKGKAQHERSSARQADVRAAYAERPQKVGSDTDG
jgi:type II secretory pathway component PulM